MPPILIEDAYDWSLGLDAELVIPAELRHLTEGYVAPKAPTRADRLMAEKTRWVGLTAQKQAAALVRGAR